jgi:hypothetical protein
LKLGAKSKIQDENSTHGKFLFKNNNNNLIKLFFLTQFGFFCGAGAGSCFTSSLGFALPVFTAAHCPHAL